MKNKNEIIHVALRTGYSFKKVYGHLKDTISASHNGFVGVADVGNTFAHAKLFKLSKTTEGLSPLYGVRLTVVLDAEEKVKPRGQFGKEHIFIARTYDGLVEIYGLMSKYFANFYYRGNVSLHDVESLTDNVIVIAEDFEYPDRIDLIGLSPRTNPIVLDEYPEIPRIALCDNYYPRPENRKVYELLTAPYSVRKTKPQYIMSTTEWKTFFAGSSEDLEKAISNTHKLAEACKVEMKSAPMIKSIDKEKIEFLCKVGAKKRGIDIKNEGEYKERYDREMILIKEKNYDDYFLVVADLIRWAKKRMFVGPSRGSSAGSLVCYLLGITEVDPIPYDLIFERFIDINRGDLPDIDIDFPDNKRDSVIKYLREKYGEKQVKQIGTLSLMKPKIAISEWARGLRIPEYETESLKNAIVERSGGDARSAMCILDTLETTEIGKEFVKEYPAMKSVSEIENHPRHSGVHAAGVIVCNDDIEKYIGVNTRDNTVMADKKEAEYLNLLKIDVLGLRTLAVLADCADQIKMKYEEFYSMDLENEEVFGVFNEMRLSGIFQFEGYSLGNITRQMGIHCFEDIVAITSLARPGALYSGGAARYIKLRLGEETPDFKGKEHEDITKNSYGIVVYQEQILRICREIGNMSWLDVDVLRRALSKSYGKEFFNKYKEKFTTGAIENNYSEEDAEFLWGEIENGGAYAFNKSHAVAYGMISFWCAYMKTYWPLEFLAANLRNSRNEDSARKILREAVRHDKVNYCAVDADESLPNWSVSNGVVLGGLTNIDGVGVANANKIISARTDPSIRVGKALMLKLSDPKTPFDVLFPTEHYWGDIFRRPRAYGIDRKVEEIKEITKKGKYVFIGQLKNKNVRDLNEYVNLVKRGGKVLDRDSLSLSIRIEDDTDTIMCNVTRFKFEEIGRHVAETGVVDKTWYIIMGEIKYEGRYVNIEDIRELRPELLEK